MTDYLDLDRVTSRQATWQFTLVDINLQSEGKLEVDRGRPPTMQVDTSRALKRTLTNVRLVPGAITDVDVIKQRLKVDMVTGDGKVWPQGIFIFTDESRVVHSSHAAQDVGSLNLIDQSMLVDQQTTTSVHYPPGTQITNAISQQLAEVPIVYTVEGSGAVISPAQEAVAWPAGTSRLRIVNELAAMIGYHELFFDNTGRGQLHPMPHPDSVDAADVIHYPVGGRTYRASTVRSTTLLKLPNRFIVVNSGATDVPVYGVYDVPDIAPHSAANRGFVVTHVEQMQGVATNADAVLAAESLAKQWRFPFETVTFAGPPDPRHDHYDAVEFENIRFLELNWSMTLSEGSEMVHELRRVYEGAT